MPIVMVTHDPSVDEATLLALADALPHAVSLAVECPEEPYDGRLRPGDVDLRFHRRGPLDRGGTTVTVEVRSTWFASRADDRDLRCERLRDQLVAAAGIQDLGVYLSLPVAGWAQTG